MRIIRAGEHIQHIPGYGISVRESGVAVAASNWWEVAGKTCVAAYQAKGAASYAASKVNLAGAGTYDLVDGTTYPTWDTALGWICNGQYLVTSANFSIDAAEARTVVGYMRLDETPGGWVGAGCPSFGSRVGNNNNFSLLIGTGNQLYGWIVGADLATSLTLSVGTFYAIAFQYDGTNMRIRRGASLASNTPGTLTTASTPLRIARDANGRMGKVTIAAAAVYADALADDEWATLSTAMAAL